MAEELVQFSSRELAWQIGKLNRHDVARIEACISMLTAECGLTLGQTHGQALGLDRRIVAKATTNHRPSEYAPSLDIVSARRTDSQSSRVDHNLDKQKEENNDSQRRTESQERSSRTDHNLDNQNEENSDSQRHTVIEDDSDELSEVGSIGTEASKTTPPMRQLVAVEL